MVSNYRIERLIGIGGEAVVYEARPLLPGDDGAPVACKLMRVERRADPVARALVVTRTLRGDFAPLPPETPADLAELAMGLLRIDRAAREPQSATEALALLRRTDQPMASEAELAALVMVMKSRRGVQPDGAHRAPSLAPGEMLEPGDVLVARTVLASGEPLPEAMPAQPPVFPLPPEPPLPPLPQPSPRVTVQLAPRRDQARRPQSSRSACVASTSRPRREAVYRAVGGALLLLCVLVSGFLLHDRLPGESNAGNMQHPEVPAPVAVPAPAPPVPVTPERPEVAETDQLARPRHSRKTQHVDGARPTRIGTQVRPRSVQPVEPHWEQMPRRSEPSVWAVP